MSTSARLHRAVVVLLTALVSVGGTTTVATAATTAPAEESEPGLYIVALEQPPRPDRPTAASRQRAAQDALLREVGGPTVLYRFSSALNGFAAKLTRAQVKQLRSDPAVALVERSTAQHIDSVHSPRFLGAPGAWQAAGGPEGAGRGTVVGVIDSGIWPENPSFAALPDSVRRGPAGFKGACQAGEQWDAADCNSKVVSARYFVKGFGEQNIAASEYLSPRDGTGHGSHVAAIAAGNHGVRIGVEGQRFGHASGMAPAARIAAYKVCWTAPDPSHDGCTTADAVAAVDQAVADGVDVISYALSGPSDARSVAVELAFLNATAAGVFVATSAGNRGPGAGTVGHASPWVTTVGASTHHLFQGSVVLGGKESFVGAMVSDQAVARTGIVLAEDAAASTSTSQEARLCKPGSLDAGMVQDKIVVCDRGTIARVDKSAAVARAGGVGMVLTNVRPDTVDSDFHAVPTVHVDVAAAHAIKKYVAETEDPTAAIDPSGSDGTPVPQIAPFSSRGPVSDGDGSVLKPDVTAPGVGVLSAVAPPSDGGRLWDLYSGTSMSAAHVAGLAALVMGEHPRWTPSMVKSSMSTTAEKLDGVSGPLAEGSGQVDAGRVLDPGVVLEVPVRSYRAWLAGRAPARNLNLPSIAVGDLTGSSRVVRRMTNVSRRTETYSARMLGLAGIGVAVRPRTLTLSPGETGRFVVRFDRETAPLEAAARGYLVWQGQRHQARMPVVVTPRTASAPGEASGSGASGSVGFPVRSGTDGAVDLRVSGLAGAKPVGLTLEPGDFDPVHPTADADTQEFPVDVPDGASLLRVELEGRDSDDLDLYLYRGHELVASAAGSGADETLTEVDPKPGDYTLYVSSAVAANGSTTTAQLYTWVVQDDAVGNLEVPDSLPAGSGEPFDVELSWHGLDPTTRWFGAVTYGDSDERTFVTLN
ncbi:MAG TPA: S8 family serine peptidase [Nocardioidaceae bacterium]|nr:S8 family serine peptidase [Nocardioidaceae bacterium]